MKELEQEVLPSLAGAAPKELAHAVFDVLDAKKAHHIRVLKVLEHTVLTDYFVLCTGNSGTQVKALADEVEYKLGLRGIVPQHFEGRDSNGWIVVDYGSVLVHIFSRENRDFYQLDKLYGDAEELHFVGIDERAQQEQADAKTDVFK